MFLLVALLASGASVSRGEDALDLYKRGAYAEAAKAFEDELASKRTVPLLLACGNCYAQTGAYEKAIARYQEALRLEPGSRDVARNLGRVYYRAARYPEAATALARGLGDASDPAELRLLGSALALSDDPDGAVWAYERAALLLPADARLRQDLAISYARAGRATDAVKAFRVAIARDPSDLSTWEMLGRAELASGRKGDAVVALDVAARLGAAGRSGFALLADVELEEGLPAAAASAYERAVATSEKPDAEDLERLGLALLRADQPEKALEALGRSVALANRGLARLYRAQALEALGRRREARAALESLVDDASAGPVREAARLRLAGLAGE
jgi:tetratricopeptide (TPR) repeat protein